MDSNAASLELTLPLEKYEVHLAKTRSGAPLSTRSGGLPPGCAWMESCHLLVELNLISNNFGYAARVSKASLRGCTNLSKPCSEASPVAGCFRTLKFGFIISAFRSIKEPSSFLVKYSALLHKVATWRRRWNASDLAS